MERINAYSRPSQGGITIDIEGMLVDLVTFAKAGGITRDMMLTKVGELWDEIKVEVTFPNEAKN